MPKKIPAVGYLRRSTDKQEASIAEQRNAVQKYADEHGYRILRWYTDDGISGDATEKRHDFQKMVADASNRRDFQAILCWDQDRFGRFSPHEASYWTFPLAKAGVTLVTTNKGPIDWNDFVQWLTYSVNQHGKHEFLRDLSRNVLRGQIEAAQAGSWIGMVPRGYRLVGPRKQKRLEPNGDADLIRRIFKEYVQEGRSLNEIARRLEADKIATTKGGPWRYDAVACILKNVAYVGTLCFYRNSRAKYASCTGGSTGTISNAARRGRNDEKDWIVRPDNHEAIIDKKTFDRAQAKLAKGKTGHNGYTPETNPFVLSGLLRCGCCGSPMWAYMGGGVPRYECSKKQEGGDCRGTTIREDQILRFIADHLQKEFLSLDGKRLVRMAEGKALKPGDLPKAFARVRQLIAPPKQVVRDKKRVETQLKSLVGQIEKARRNLVLLDEENIPIAQDEIRKLEKQRESVQQEMQKRPPSPDEINAEALEVLYNLHWLAVLFFSKDERARRCSSARQYLNRVNYITVHTKKQGKGTGTRHRFDRGEIVFGQVGAVTSKENLHRLFQSQAAYR